MKRGITFIIKHIIPLCSWSPAPLESPEGDSVEAELWVLLPHQELGHLYMESCSFSLSIAPGHLNSPALLSTQAEQVLGSPGSTQVKLGLETVRFPRIEVGMAPTVGMSAFYG